MKSRRYCSGHLPDRHFMFQTGARFIGSPLLTSLPRSVKLEAPDLPDFDQGQTNSCVGFGLSTSVNLTIANTQPDKPNPIVSPVGVYTIGRCIARPFLTDKFTPLEDVGSSPSAAVKGMSLVGIPSIEHWGNYPADPETINDEPNIGQLEVGSAFKLDGFHRKDAIGDVLMIDLMGTLAANHSFSFTFYVDEKVEDYAGGILSTPDMSSLYGTHYVAADGYEWDGKDLRSVVFSFRNSWGLKWGEAGRGRGGRDWFQSWYGDIYVLGVT